MRTTALLITFLCALPAISACSTPVASEELARDHLVPQQTARWEAAGRVVELQAGRLVEGDEVLADDVIGAPAFDASGRRMAVAVLADAPYTAVVVRERTRSGWGPARVLVGGDADAGSPDRVAISPDGQTVAFVRSSRGLPAVWVVPFTGGAPRQLTNVELARAPGGPPKGYLPPPHLQPPRFSGRALEWDSEAGPQRVWLP